MNSFRLKEIKNCIMQNIAYMIVTCVKRKSITLSSVILQSLSMEVLYLRIISFKACRVKIIANLEVCEAKASE